MYLVIFFSCKLSQAERNNNIGNCKLLPIKLMLEWRRWLKAASCTVVGTMGDNKLALAKYLTEVVVLGRDVYRLVSFFLSVRSVLVCCRQFADSTAVWQ